MNSLLEKFLEDEKNKELYIKGVILKNRDALEILQKKFNDYLFRVYFCSYIKKSISFAAAELKQKEKQIEAKEGLYLNVVDPDFKEEKINIVPDTPTDFIEEIYKNRENVDYCDIVTSKRILQAIGKLTDRQKEILYECVIRNQNEKIVAKKLGISKQAVNKIKKAALNKLRKELEGKYFGNVK
ncbi:MAG TPA: sigma factor-like helix-turn-helix DNA-binding protein [Tissierellaceae bacterium]